MKAQLRSVAPTGRRSPSVAPDDRDLVVLDGDDTLWKTQELYDSAKAEFARLLKRWGFKSQPIELLDRIDAEAAQARGFSVARFIDSMLETYRLLNGGEQRICQHAEEQAIRELAMPIVGEYALYEDAVETLEALRQAFRLVLATKGERRLQEQKIRQLGLEHYFEHAFVLERKTEVEHRLILEKCAVKPSRAWAVGNSVRSDINPALRIGMRAVWIQRPTWLYEEAALAEGDVAAVTSLKDAGAVLLARQERALQHQRV